MKRSSFIFKENHVFLEGEAPQTKLLKWRKNKIKFIYIYIIYIYVIYILYIYIYIYYIWYWKLN